MINDIKDRLDDPNIQELIGYAVFPDPDQLAKTIAAYGTDPKLQLLGYISEGDVIGVVGFAISEANELTIEHIAVLPEMRGGGYGRGMILELLHLKAPKAIFAETDEEAVHFYRSIGFTVESLGEKYPGTERFLCSYYVDEAGESV